MKYEELPDKILVGKLVLQRTKENASCVYYDSPDSVDLVEAHVCYGREEGDFCGHIVVPGHDGTVFNSLGGHKHHFHPERGRDCYTTIPPLVAAMEKQLRATLKALREAIGDR